VSGASRRNHFNRRDEELEQRDEKLKCLRRLVRDLELEARGRCRRRDHEELQEGSASVRAIMEQVHINLDLIAIGIACENMQTKIRFARRSDDPETLPWML